MKKKDKTQLKTAKTVVFICPTGHEWHPKLRTANTYAPEHNICPTCPGRQEGHPVGSPEAVAACQLRALVIVDILRDEDTEVIRRATATMEDRKKAQSILDACAEVDTAVSNLWTAMAPLDPITRKDT